MKAIVLFFCVTVFAVNSLPRNLPEDNDSRYAWISNDAGESQLVDLLEPVDYNLLNSRNGANNAYWLFTRRNANNGQLIRNGNANSISSSNYNRNLPLKVIVHGWTGSLNSELNHRIRGAFLAAADVNVIVVDWHALASANYVTAALGVPGVGEHLGNFLTWLINTGGGNWNNVHLVGFSLGAHAVGVAGRRAGSRARRVTGLDPASVGWNGNANAISKNAGRYVEIMHTNIGAMGLRNAVGHADFYPNGGDKQPGCNNDSCSHSRAWDLFASTVQINRLVGRRCSNLNQALNNQCTGGNFNMGNGILSKSGTGIYGLRTGNSWPY